jgi:hypothetical protein
MSDAAEKKLGWKKKIGSELIEYGINSLYLFFFFSVFILYRKLVLAEYKISYLLYGVALIEALVLAKIIMIGNIMGLARRLQDKPLILPTLYKTVVFTVLTGIFVVLEHMVNGLLHGGGLGGGIHEMMSNGYQVLARGLVVFFAFIPFFAFKELGRVLGAGRIADLFLRKVSGPVSSTAAGSSARCDEYAKDYAEHHNGGGGVVGDAAEEAGMMIDGITGRGNEATDDWKRVYNSAYQRCMKEDDRC